MSKTKAIMCGVIFIALTVLKFSYPPAMWQIQEKVVPVLSENSDYKQAITAIGRNITADNRITKAVGKYYPNILKGEEKPQPDFWKNDEDQIQQQKKVQLQSVMGARLMVSVNESKQETKAGLMESEPEPEPETEPESSYEPEPEIQEEPKEEEMPEAVATFLDSQQAFSDYAVPASVSYEMPSLPIEYTTPVVGYSSSGFGYRNHPIANEVRFHYGTDFSADSGTDILSFATGTVIEAGESDSFGKYIIIQHDHGYKSLYAHCNALYVSQGEAVEKGQLIALVGSTGYSTGSHLHFELRCDDIYLNPEYYI